MCVIERYDIVHSDGYREPRDNLHHCHYGTPRNPCNNTVTRRTEDRFVEPPEAPLLFGEIEPRPRKTRKSRKFMDGLKLVFDFHIPFTSKKTDNKKKKNKNKTEVSSPQRRESRRHYSPPQPNHTPPRMPAPYPTPRGHPGVVHVPSQPSPRMMGPQVRPQVQVIHPNHDRPIDAVHLQHSSSSPSPDMPLRERTRQHRRKESADREYEAQKMLILERERRAYAEKIAREAEIARLKAERDVELMNDNQNRLTRERERRERAERVAREAETARLRAERDAEIVRRDAERDAEIVRRDAEKDQRRIRYEERRRIETAERIRRRQEQEEWEREQARLLQEQEDRERIHAAQIQDDRHRAWEERQRRERLRQLNIPHGPRHWPTVTHHPHVSFAERGVQIINDAIEEAEDRRRSWHPAPEPRRGGSRRRSIGERPRRRDNIVYDDDNRRGGRRFV